MKILGFLCVAIGLLIAIFGSVVITIYVIYDIIMNFNTLTAGQIFWDVVWLVIRDIVSILVGVSLYMLGMVLISDN